mmetsp:Transcript_3786/g.2820  ORF Transcript_3786/g.2820 Transcript_3786/m.2820 type:complete len:148 (-) Transcript_3786:526-969(-)
MPSEAFTLLPHGYLIHLQTMWQQTSEVDIECDSLCYFQGRCSDHTNFFGYIQFNFQNVSLWLNADQYMMEGSEFGMDGMCIFAFQEYDGPAVLLGASFMRYFYSIFDWQKQRIGLAFNTYNQPLLKEIDLPEPEPVPEEPSSSSSSE